VLEDPGINTVDITTPTLLHAPMCVAAARAGKNIHCEKPFCLGLQEGLAACKEAEKHGVVLMVGESYMFMTSIMNARALIEVGEIGKPQQIRQRFGTWVENVPVPWIQAARSPMTTVAGAWIPSEPSAPASGGCSTIACTSSLLRSGRVPDE